MQCEEAGSWARSSQEKEAELEELRQEVRRLEARVRASHRDLQAQADKAELQRRFAAAAQVRARGSKRRERAGEWLRVGWLGGLALLLSRIVSAAS